MHSEPAVTTNATSKPSWCSTCHADAAWFNIQHQLRQRVFDPYTSLWSMLDTLCRSITVDVVFGHGFTRVVHNVLAKSNCYPHMTRHNPHGSITDVRIRYLQFEYVRCVKLLFMIIRPMPVGRPRSGCTCSSFICIRRPRVTGPRAGSYKK